MSITQTVDIPPSRRLIVDVPGEVPAGKTILTFTPINEVMADCPLCAEHRDSKTGELRFNAETIAAIEEGRAMLRGEIPTKWYDSLDEMWEDLENEDSDD